MVLEPEVLKDVMIRKFKHFHDNEFGELIDKEQDPLFSRNPFFLKGEEWKDKRAEVTPAFTPNRLKALFPLIEDVQQRLVKYIADNLKKSQPFDARELSAKYTTDVVASAIFGVDAQSFAKDKPEIREMGRRLLDLSGFLIMKMFLLTSIPMLKVFLKIQFVKQDVHDFFINLMKDALKYREENKIQREDFLDHLLHLKAKKGLAEADMAAHTLSFFTDGFETSSIAICHAIYEVSTAVSLNIYMQFTLMYTVGQQSARAEQVTRRNY